MNENNFSFNLSDANGARYTDDFSPIPTGWYAALIDETEIEKYTSSKDGVEGENTSLKAVHVLAGKHFANRKVFHNFPLRSTTNEAFANTGKAQLASVCEAQGVQGFPNSQAMQGKLMAIKVVEVPEVKNPDGSQKYKAKNQVRGWKPLSELEALQAELNKPEYGGRASGAAAPVGDTGSDPFDAGNSTNTDASTPAQPWEEPVAETAKAEPAAAASKEATKPVVQKVEQPKAEAKPAAAAGASDDKPWEADGWKAHPKSAKHAFKGQEVKLLTDLAVMYAPAPPLEEEAPGIPDIDDAPSLPDDAGEATPPWAEGE